jgi:hypothetical protein
MGPVHMKRVSVETTVVCTKVDPWKEIKRKPGILVLHPDQVETRSPAPKEWPGTELIVRECPNCGHKWDLEYRILKI